MKHNMDLNAVMNISNFLSYLQGIGVINNEQYEQYSKYIKPYLTEKYMDRRFLEDFFDEILNKEHNLL